MRLSVESDVTRTSPWPRRNFEIISAGESAEADGAEIISRDKAANRVAMRMVNFGMFQFLVWPMRCESRRETEWALRILQQTKSSRRAKQSLRASWNQGPFAGRRTVHQPSRNGGCAAQH